MHVGGAVKGVASNATAFPHRDAIWVVGAEALWTSPQDDISHLKWSKDATAALQVVGGGTAYVNYADPNLGHAAFPAAYYRDNYERLQEAKCKWDPEDLFGFAQGITCPHSGVASV
jgi:hypothetical protein